MAVSDKKALHLLMLLGLTLILTGLSAAQPIAPGAWDMNEGSGQWVYDSLNNNDGYLGEVVGPDSADPLWSTDRVEGSHSLEFQGGDDTVRIPYDSSLNTETLTMTAWVKPDVHAGETDSYVASETSIHNDARTIFSKMWTYKMGIYKDGTFVATVRSDDCLDSSGNPGAWCKVTDVYHGWVDSGYVIPKNEWTRVGFSWDGQYYDFYVDGTHVKRVKPTNLADSYAPIKTDVKKEAMIGSKAYKDCSSCSHYYYSNFDGNIDSINIEGSVVTPPPPAEKCGDGIDNDGDGQVDEGCTACDDGIDNDGDGDVDMADPGCTSPSDDDESNPRCSDGIDNDGDGLIDYGSDPGCSGPSDDTEDNGDEVCGDGLDNDGNGKIDDGCPVCNNSKDDDGDGLIDYGSDPGCTGPSDGTEKPPYDPDDPDDCAYCTPDDGPDNPSDGPGGDDPHPGGDPGDWNDTYPESPTPPDMSTEILGPDPDKDFNDDFWVEVEDKYNGNSAFTSSYLGHWPMNHLGSDQILRDIGTTPIINGTLGFDKSAESSDPQWSKDRVEGRYSLKFDGQDDFVDIDFKSGASIDDISVAAWVKPTDLSAPSDYGFNVIASKAQVYKMGIHPDGTFVATVDADCPGDPSWCYKSSGSYGAYVPSGFKVPENKWTHVRFTWNQTHYKFYKNGDLKKTVKITSTPHPIAKNDLDLSIGAKCTDKSAWCYTNTYSDTAPVGHFTGMIDDVKIRSADAADVECLYMVQNGTASTDFKTNWRSRRCNEKFRVGVPEICNVPGEDTCRVHVQIRDRAGRSATDFEKFDLASGLGGGSCTTYPDGTRKNLKEDGEREGRLKNDKEVCTTDGSGNKKWFDPDTGDVDGDGKQDTCPVNTIYGPEAVRWIPGSEVRNNPRAFPGGIDDDLMSGAAKYESRPYQDSWGPGETPIPTGNDDTKVSTLGFCAGDDESEFVITQKCKGTFCSTDDSVLGVAQTSSSCVLDGTKYPVAPKYKERRVYSQGQNVTFQYSSDQTIACFDGYWYTDWPIAVESSEASIQLGRMASVGYSIVNIRDTTQTYRVTIKDGPLKQFARLQGNRNQMEVEVPGKTVKTLPLKIYGGKKISEDITLQVEAVDADIYGEETVAVNIGDSPSGRSDTPSVPGIQGLQILALLIAGLLFNWRFRLEQ